MPFPIGRSSSMATPSQVLGWVVGCGDLGADVVVDVHDTAECVRDRVASMVGICTPYRVGP